MRLKLAILSITGLFLLTSCNMGAEHYNFGSYSEGERLFTKGQYEKAIQQYQSYIDQYPEGNLAVISQYYIGKSLAAMGKADEAKKAYQKLMKDHPNVVWANFAETQLKELESRPQSAQK